ncbi:Protein shisa-5 [Myotis brandtii]|uniref:Protein shisa-5 n=1 Tax=Myotis brandtii TaxID=109478 RepID=S7PAQ0_MYOBR|nr:Protein shisa-5 [Myotis brandtii]
MLAGGDSFSPKTCPMFCCGTCYNQYCCSDILKSVWNKEGCADNQDSLASVRNNMVETFPSSLKYTDIDTDPLPGGLTIFVLFIVTIIACFTCSCCCLYKMCRRPRPIVTTTTATTVVHAPYPQPAGVPPSYPGPSVLTYQAAGRQVGGNDSGTGHTAHGLSLYPAQPVGPPAYHETLAGDAAMAYPASQPPYNPAYMDPPKATR